MNGDDRALTGQLLARFCLVLDLAHDAVVERDRRRALDIRHEASKQLQESARLLQALADRSRVDLRQLRPDSPRGSVSAAAVSVPEEMSNLAAYDSPGHADPLPGIPGFQSHDSAMTAPGSAGVMGAPDIQNGAVIGNPIVSDYLASSQIPANLPTHPVTQGMTSGFSDDHPVHAGPIFGSTDATPYEQTGAGSGTAITTPHPNSGR